MSCALVISEALRLTLRHSHLQNSSSSGTFDLAIASESNYQNAGLCQSFNKKPSA